MTERYSSGPSRTDGGTAIHEDIYEPMNRIADGYLSIEDGAIRYLNESASDLLALPDERALGASPEACLPPELASVYREVRTESEEAAFDVYAPASERWLSGSAYATDHGVALVFRDVTAQKQLSNVVERNEAALERLHDIAADTDLSLEEKIERLLAVGCDRLDTATGFLTQIDEQTQEILTVVGEDDTLTTGMKTPLSEAYCRHTIGSDTPVAITEAKSDGWEEDPAYRRFGLECYLGATIFVDDEPFGTVCFADEAPRNRQFSEREVTFAELLTDWITYLLEQLEYQRELEHEQAFIESLFDYLPDPLYAFDATGKPLRWNARLEEVSGYDPEQLERMRPDDFVVAEDRQPVYQGLQDIKEGETVSVEATMETKDGDHIPYEFSGGPLRGQDGDVIGLVGVGRDISERVEHERRLASLLETTRSLMQACDRDHVAQITVDAAEELLGFDLCVFRLYDEETDSLRPVAKTEGVTTTIGKLSDYASGEGVPGSVFETGEARIIPDTGAAHLELNPGRMASAMVHPVGTHGTISIGSTERHVFDETDEHILALLATNAAAACLRAEREREVVEAREHTERVLDRVNGLVQQTMETLVQATTREELEAGVVAELASAGPFSFAMIGRPDVSGEYLSSSAVAGASPEALADRTLSVSDPDCPIGAALAAESIQIVEDVTELEGEGWSEIATQWNVEALAVLPLVYKDVTYGVLVVLARNATALDERERQVLEALGRAIANAINAIERGRILDATDVVELEFSTTDRSMVLSRLSSDSAGIFEIAGTKPQSDGTVRLYLSGTDTDVPAIIQQVRNDPEIQSVTSIVEHDHDCLLEIVLEESILATLTEYGAVPTSIIAEDGEVRCTVELPYEAEAREFFELVESRYPDTTLLGYHERERSVETRQEFTAALGERLTDRQETALRTAYLSGYFSWPRDVDGTELAEAMDISRTTYHQHLRAAQAKVFEELFD